MSWDMERVKRTVSVVDDEWSDKNMARYVARGLSFENTFTILNVQDVIRKATNWRLLMPRIQPFYAIKCNNNPVVLEVLAALGMGFDCASMVEIDKVLATGINPNRIIFAHTAKPRPHLLHARSKGVDLLTFDSHTELLKIKMLHPNARLLVRIRCDAKIALNFMSQKFGCCPYTEAPALMKTAKELNLKVLGVCFHVGSGCEEPEAYRRGAAIARRLFNIGKDFGHQMEVLDIGGGFPGDRGSYIEEIANVVNQAIDEYFPISSGVKIISEPGRYFVSSAFTLACSVHSARVTTVNSKNNDTEATAGQFNGGEAQTESGKGVLNKKVTDEAIYSTDREAANGNALRLTNDNDNHLYSNVLTENVNKEQQESNVDSSHNAINENYAETEFRNPGTFLNGHNNCKVGPHCESSSNENSIQEKKPEKHIMYFMDNGLYASFAGITSTRLILEPETLEDVEGPLISSSLWGPTCDGIDMVLKDILLPALPLPSWLLFHSFGAYTTTTATKFNGFEEPTEHAFMSRETWNELMQLSHFNGKHRLNGVTIPAGLPAPLSPSWPSLSALTSPRTLTSALRMKKTNLTALPDTHSPLFSIASPTSTVQSPMNTKYYTPYSCIAGTACLLRSSASPSSTVLSPPNSTTHVASSHILRSPTLDPSVPTSTAMPESLETPPSVSKTISLTSPVITQEINIHMPRSNSDQQESNLINEMSAIVLSPMRCEAPVPLSPVRRVSSPTPVKSPTVHAY